MFASLIGSESDKYPLVWAACSFGTLASSLDFSQTRDILDSMVFMSSWSGWEIIGIIAWIPELSTLELLAARDESMASTITWWEESTLNWESWEGVLVEGSAEICMCWEVSLLTEKRFCSVPFPLLVSLCLKDYMYYQKMIGWCCPLACRLDVGELFLLDLVQISSDSMGRH